jgi:hypothetical protein
VVERERERERERGSDGAGGGEVSESKVTNPVGAF